MFKDVVADRVCYVLGVTKRGREAGWVEAGRDMDRKDMKVMGAG